MKKERAYPLWTDWLVWYDVFADGEAHPGTEPKRRNDWTSNDAISSHDARGHIAQSSCHFASDLFNPILPLLAGLIHIIAEICEMYVKKRCRIMCSPLVLGFFIGKLY